MKKITCHNQFKQDMLERKKLIGCWAALGNPISTEILGLAGFDWLLLDGEHAINDVMTFVPQLMALKDSISAPVVRPASNDQVLIKRLLDIGFYNFLIPYIETVEQAKQAVSYTRYPPEGLRGVSVAHRSNAFGTIPDYFTKINQNICVMVQIETQQAVDNVEAITAVEGVDGIFVGPSDLSASLGHFGNPKHPDVQATIKHVFEVAKTQGKACGILAPIEADAHHYIAMGATFVAVGSDLSLLRNSTQTLADKFLK
ncbi:2-dehydro-3-deoxyglucarate aldolase [Gilliamella apicola]|uniref:2-dehydro-3-deoxyglucarate aldolase n=1 Tax=Gilliamella apicola TaxID=1196095 RepID=A0A556SWF0_9GAMM|nr:MULTISPECIES: 2-dehydro-3-deoxyglucarate aldolase [Gilliamella]MBI0028956.1 2-dehydro-3-deoxyglucarate aldolase [Gilliamella sp. B14448G7]MBI0030431.1 2-dehydro-3-deoxyglucarate aldolase [Gilliamella sp. B14384G15]MBI0036077.1 2-dehydro-3-deoxyglucarate aldolase [Gilliamella sp. B14448G11]MBI0043074.1 2-dehydro-3-deoxyglucarate aldolase [Gilliamella sp. B14448G12]MBI0056937.1 2-dehydro-3-deoxyglucarate aldolase [Gilliamella sp. B14384G12]